jgi:hypothetical protein
MKALFLLILFIVSGCGSAPPKNGTNDKVEKDYLLSWNDKKTKYAIVEYVRKVTTEGTNDFIPIEDRIATFDNDGTLWSEKPLVQAMFAMSKVGAMGLEYRPEHKLSDKEMMDLIVKTHTGMSEPDFEQEVKTFFAKAMHPTLNVPISQTLYQPQLELMAYLRSHKFTIYISSGGTSDFMRMISKPYYGVPVDNVIGSNFQYSYDETGNKLMRLPKLDNMNDKGGKPIAIHKHLGKRPVIAVGNVGGEGDVEMLRYSQGSPYKSLQLLVNHDDADREFAYSEESGKSLNWAEKYNWNVISIKNDWKKVFNHY